MLQVACLMLVSLPCFTNENKNCQFETAVYGKVLEYQNEIYKVDFSVYAKKQGYQDKSWAMPRYVEAERCVIIK